MRHIIRPLALSFWLVALAIAPELIATEPSPIAELPLAVVLDTLKDTHIRISSIYIEYRFNYPLSPGRYFERVIALKEPSFIYHSNMHGSASLDARDDPFRVIARLSRDHWSVEKVNSGTVSGGPLSPTEPAIGTLPKEWLYWATGIWPLKSRPAPKLYGAKSYAILDYVNDLGEKKLRPLQEEIGGRWCYVIERPGIDVLWLDMARSAAVLSREVSFEKSEHVAYRVFLEQQVEIAEGLWLPKRVRDIRFQESEVPGTHGIEYHFDVVQLRVNNIDDSIFEYTVTPGAYCLNSHATSERQIDPRSQAHFDRLIFTARRLLPESRNTSILASLTTGVCFVLCLLCAALYRLRGCAGRTIRGRPAG